MKFLQINHTSRWHSTILVCINRVQGEMCIVLVLHIPRSFSPPPTRTFEKHSFFLTDPMKRKFPSKQTRTSRQVNKRPTTIVYKDNINNRERKESGKKMRSLFRDLRTVYLFTSLFLSSIWFAYFANDLPHDLAPYPLWKIKMLVHTKSFNLYDIYDCRWNTVRTKIEFCKGIFFLCFFHFT